MTSDFAPLSAFDRVAGLTLYPTQDGRWQASVSSDRIGWRTEIHENPIEALRRALGLKSPETEVGLEDLL